MGQPKKTYDEVLEIVGRIEFMDRKVVVSQVGEGYHLQVQYMEVDVDTGKMELQKARKWYISPYSTETEIVETAFKACRTSMDHVLKEHFLYRGRRVYSPHFDINARIAMCDAKQFDGRVPLLEKP